MGTKIKIPESVIPELRLLLVLLLVYKVQYASKWHCIMLQQLPL